MHSSRVRTARFSCRLRAGGGLYVGGVCPGVCLPRDVPAWEEGMPRGCTTPLHAGIHPPVNRMTHRCKTLHCPKLRLRTMITISGWTVTASGDTILRSTSLNEGKGDYHTSCYYTDITNASREAGFVEQHLLRGFLQRGWVRGSLLGIGHSTLSRKMKTRQKFMTTEENRGRMKFLKCNKLFYLLSTSQITLKFTSRITRNFTPLLLRSAQLFGLESI